LKLFTVFSFQGIIQDPNIHPKYILQYTSKTCRPDLFLIGHTEGSWFCSQTANGKYQYIYDIRFKI